MRISGSSPSGNGVPSARDGLLRNRRPWFGSIRRDPHIPTCVNLAGILIEVNSVRVQDHRSVVTDYFAAIVRTTRNHPDFHVTSELKNGLALLGTRSFIVLLL